MINKLKFISISIIFFSLIFLTIFIEYTQDFHLVVIHLYYLFIVLAASWYKKYLPIALMILISLHFFKDYTNLNAFPWDAFWESISQIFIAGILYFLNLKQASITKHLKTYTNVTQTGTWEWYVQTDKSIYSSEWAHLIGYELEELGTTNSSTLKNFIHPDDLDLVMNKLDYIFSQHIDTYESEFRMKHKDGHWVWILDRGKIIKWTKDQKPEVMVGTHTDISQIKELQLSLNFEIQRFKSLVKASPDIIFQLDRNLIYTSVFGKWSNERKLDENFYIGRSIVDIHQGADAKLCLDACEKVFKGKTASYVWTETNKEQVTHYQTILSPLYNDAHEVISIVGMARDITELKTTQQELVNANELTQYIIEYASSSVAVFDLNMNYVYVSQSFIEQYEIKEKDVIGKNHYDLFPNISEETRLLNDHSMQGEVIHKDIDEYHHADGRLDFSTWTTRPWYKYDGKIGGIILYSQFITDNVKLKNELNDRIDALFIEKNQAESTLHSIGDAVISTDSDGLIVSINPIAQELTGWTKDEAIGTSFIDVFSITNETTGKRTHCPVKLALETKKPVKLKNHTILKSKTGHNYYIEDSASPIKNQKGEVTGAVLVFRDVTEEKKRQREIEYMNYHDFSTNLYNRRFFVEQLSKLDTKENYPLGIMMIDLNGLKIYNDAFGHETGDIVLKIVADILSKSCTEVEFVSRIGGDEFTIIIPNATGEKVEKISNCISTSLKDKKVNNIQLSLAMGVAYKEEASQDLDDVIKRSENEMYRNKIAEGMSVRNHAISAILKTLTDKFDEERIHSERVSKISLSIGQALNLSDRELRELEMAGLYHDIGKIAIPDSILKKPAKLTDAEYNVIKTHTEVGYQILRAADEYSDLAEYARSHHERWDGKGYPQGLKALDIPLFSRIIAVADSFEAMTADRPYRKKMSDEEAIKEIVRCSGTQFDPEIADVFLTKIMNQNL
ncbi:MAG: PAS domain S-box protein [Acholeplasmataceae bacterium]|nr:PAS domain S-box protein [Acholeplasmataceae bacterium]